MNKLRERFDSQGFTIAVMNNPNQTSDTALLKAIAAEFGLKPPRTKQGAFDQLQEFLAREVVEGHIPILLLDEAQDLRNSIRADRDMLGMIKALTNLMLENERLVQIILFGRLELIPLLKKRRELMSRVAQFGVLSPPTKENAIAMMERRWKTPGGKLPLPLMDEALEFIYQAAKGLPRDIPRERSRGKPRDLPTRDEVQEFSFRLRDELKVKMQAEVPHRWQKELDEIARKLNVNCLN